METDRIVKNEERLDSVTFSVKELEKAVEDFKRNMKNIDLLNRYYGSASWFKDKESYEKNLIPKVKAGVLSEDAVWNLNEDIADVISEMKSIVDKYYMKKQNK